MISESFYLPSLDSVEYNIQQHVWHKNWVLYKGTHAAAQTPSLAFVAPTQVSAKREKKSTKGARQLQARESELDQST